MHKLHVWQNILIAKQIELFTQEVPRTVRQAYCGERENENKVIQTDVSIFDK